VATPVAVDASAPTAEARGDAAARAQIADARACHARVRLLRARLRMHQQVHGRLPATLDELRAPHVSPETFQVPGTGEPYVYLGPEGQGGILLHGRPNGPGPKVTLLTTSLEIDRVSEADLRRRLEGGAGREDR
jgi:hypothetical protein